MQIAAFSAGKSIFEWKVVRRMTSLRNNRQTMGTYAFSAQYPDYSRVISPAAVERLASLIDPKKVIYGGKFDPPARYLDPTILYPVSWSDKIMKDEIFGPLLPILTYSDLGTLLAKIKSLPKPLAGYISSRGGYRSLVSAL